VASYTLKFGVGEIPRPPYWRGFRIAPVYIEFWKDGAFRLHDRVIFRRESSSSEWTKTRFYP
jgi:pyridoxamine 5'-phosphate oxidase